jgi:putative spermidine/putrescine transport system ATP-binding protein
VQVHVAADGAAGADDNDESPARGVWTAALPDAEFHARPLQPGQRVAMRWPDGEAHSLKA